MLHSLAPVLYVKLSPERLTIRNVKSGTEISEVPEISIGNVNGRATVLAIGAGARANAFQNAAQLVNPFAHPRSLMSDFTVGEQVLKQFVRRISGRGIFRLAPRIVMHPLGSPDGGYTQVEDRAFREMALGAGASQAIVWVGRELRDDEVLSSEVLKPPGLLQ
ncbi:MAG: rod shape-determining protein [Ramlibacter sp.]|nr:rod shape-determining protein [Ramlibacter sp.]